MWADYCKAGAGVVLTHKREQHSNRKGECQTKFSIELVRWSEHSRSLGFYQAKISKNLKLLTVIARTSGDVLKCNYTVRERKKHWIQLQLNLFKHFSFIVSFIWCTVRYTVRQTLVRRNVTRGTKLQGVQRAPELVLRSTEFRSPENLIFPALLRLKWNLDWKWYNIFYETVSIKFFKLCHL